ncbi:MAG: hypothetical protein JRJ84_13270, partial [Deltaproteobacteria bacterium]|nr:hypothetical protein [Deltaproteobacteria bacterium]
MKIQGSHTSPISQATQQPGESERDETRPSAPDVSSGDVDQETARDMQDHQGNQDATRATTESTRNTPPASQTPVLDVASNEVGEEPSGGGESVEEGEGGHTTAEPGGGGGGGGESAPEGGD